MGGMKNKEPVITHEQARLYVYTKMYESGHTPASFAQLFGVSRQSMSLILLGKRQPGPRMLRALGMIEVYGLPENPPALPPGPKHPEVLKSRAELAASGPQKKARKSPAKKKQTKPKEGK